MDCYRPLLYFSAGAASLVICSTLYTAYKYIASDTTSPFPSPLTTYPRPHHHLPYPPNLIPNPRTINTPYGDLQTYVWGPRSGRRVLLLHGISGGSVVLLTLAETLAAQGCRVMLVDLWGRGWSGGPKGRYDSGLYCSLVFCAVAGVGWMGESPGSAPGDAAGSARIRIDADGRALVRPGQEGAFTLIGYSLGGGIAADFASYFPHLVQDLVLIAPGGLLRSDWRSRVLYSGLVPKWWMKRILRRRLLGAGYVMPSWTGEEGPDSNSGQKRCSQDEDEERDDMSGRRQDYRQSPVAGAKEERAGQPTSGSTFLERIKNIDADAVVAWQLEHNPGFVHAFASSIKYAPTKNQQHRWQLIGDYLFAQKDSPKDPDRVNAGDGVKSGSYSQWKDVLLVLGGQDSIVRPEDTVPEAQRVLGEGNLEVKVYEEAGHSVGMSHGQDIAEMLLHRWQMKVP